VEVFEEPLDDLDRYCTRTDNPFGKPPSGT
jgi:hypothetical protein